MFINFVKKFEENAEKLKIIEEEFDFVFFSLDNFIDLLPNTCNGFLFCKVCFSFFVEVLTWRRKLRRKKLHRRKKLRRNAVRRSARGKQRLARKNGKSNATARLSIFSFLLPPIFQFLPLPHSIIPPVCRAIQSSERFLSFKNGDGSVYGCF